MSREEHRKGKIEINIHDSLYTLGDYPWRKITEWFEYHLAVKWYVIQAMMDGKEAGFLHLVRHPEDPGVWYLCDVHTKPDCQKKGVATKMYEAALDLVKQYDKAYRVLTSVHQENQASVALHRKMGFQDTGEKSVFPELSFEPEETMYSFSFVFEWPAGNSTIHRELFRSMWEERQKEGGHFNSLEEFYQVLEEAEENKFLKVHLFWAGEKPVGYRVLKTMEDGETKKVLDQYFIPSWQALLDDGALNILTPDNT